MQTGQRKGYFPKSENINELFDSINEIILASFEFSKKEPAIHKAVSLCLFNTETQWKTILQQELNLLKSLMHTKVLPPFYSETSKDPFSLCK